MERANFRRGPGAQPPPPGVRSWQPPTEATRERGPRVDRQQLADTIRVAAAEAYRNRTRYNEATAFGGLKRAVDSALGPLRAQGLGGIADRLTARIAHYYTVHHRHGTGVRAIEAFYQAVEDGLNEFVEQGA